MSQRSLNDLKAGDTVAITTTGHIDGSGLSRGIVVRITKTQIIAKYKSDDDCEVKFRKTDGCQVGEDSGGFRKTTVSLFTAEHARIIRSCNLQFKVAQIVGIISKHKHLVTAAEARDLDRIRLNLKARAAGIKE